MWPDRVSNSGPLTYESGALPTALRGPAIQNDNNNNNNSRKKATSFHNFHSGNKTLYCFVGLEKIVRKIINVNVEIKI